MGAYAFSCLLAASSCYLASLLLVVHAERKPLRLRASAALFLLGGFFLSTYLRTTTSSPAAARLFILSIYAHAILLPAILFDFVSLYTFSSFLRKWLVPLAYGLGISLVTGLAFGFLIAGVRPHPQLAFYGVPGPLYKVYLFYVIAFPCLALAQLLRSYHDSPSFRSPTNRLLILAFAVGLPATFSTLLPTFHLIRLPWLACGAYLVPCFIIYAFYRHGLLQPIVGRSNLAALATLMATLIATFAVLLVLIETLILRRSNPALTLANLTAFAVLMSVLFFANPALKEYVRSVIYSRKEAEETVRRVLLSIAFRPLSLAGLAQRIAAAIEEHTAISDVLVIRRTPACRGSQDSVIAGTFVGSPPTPDDCSGPGITHSIGLPSRTLSIVKLRNCEILLHLGPSRAGRVSRRDMHFIRSLMPSLAVAVMNSDLFDQVTSLTESISEIDRKLALPSKGGVDEKLSGPSDDVSVITRIVNHDIKNMLLAVLLQARELQKRLREASPEGSAEIATNIQADIEQTLDLVQGINVLFSAEEAASSSEWIDLSQFLHDLLQVLGRKYQTSDRVVEMSDLPAVYAPRNALYHVFFNLLDNAFKYSGDNLPPRIWVSTTQGESGLSLAIEDNGTGIKPKELPRVVLPFIRGSNRTVRGAEVPGTGVGLSIVDKVARSMGWTFSLSSTYGVGCTAVLSIPSHLVSLMPDSSGSESFLGSRR